MSSTYSLFLDSINVALLGKSGLKLRSEQTATPVQAVVSRSAEADQEERTPLAA